LARARERRHGRGTTLQQCRRCHNTDSFRRANQLAVTQEEARLRSVNPRSVVTGRVYCETSGGPVSCRVQTYASRFPRVGRVRSMKTHFAKCSQCQLGMHELNHSRNKNC
jgi:hypothetical protein